MKRNTRQWAVSNNDFSGVNSSVPEGPKLAKKRSKKTIQEAIPVQNDVSPYFQDTDVSGTSYKPGEKLGRRFYDQDAVTLAKALLGKVLCRKLPGTDQILKGTIVETEAYPGVGDAASHSFKGVPTESSMPMFMEPGTAYVYFTYGMYHCFNVSSKDVGGAVLFRGLEVYEDYEIMHTMRRPKKKQDHPEENKPSKRLKQHELANGPSKLCMALDINRSNCNKIDLTVSDDLWLEESAEPIYQLQQFQMKESRRVGIDSTPLEARNQLYRFYIGDNKSVSPAKFKEVASSKSKRAQIKKK